MTLIEPPEVLDRRKVLPTRHFDESSSGSDDEFIIASEDYPEESSGAHRDFFSLPTFSFNNYLNNLNLSLNLRNSPLWRIYENTPNFPKPATLLANYLGKQGDDLDLNEEGEVTRSYFTIANFLRKHGFPVSFEEDISEEAWLERWKKGRKFEERSLITDYGSDGEGKEYLFSERVKDERVAVPKIVEQKIETKVMEEVTLAKEESEQSDVNFGCTTVGPVGPGTLNPFYNRYQLTAWDKFKIAVLTLTVVPIKVFFMVVTLTLALLVSLVGMYGISFEESQCLPLPKWRRGFRWALAHVFMKLFIFSSGFVWNVKHTGKPATPEEAPIFVVGPHSSFFDAFAVVLLGAPSVVAKLSTKDIPVFGRLVTFTQAVYVSRESKGSRRQTLETLRQRAQDVNAGSGMPQIFIFPEGTCSNRSSLIKFKVGAFAPGVPVQPVIIRYPNQFDACSWTFDGPPVIKNIWFSLAQFYNKIEIEYLPVYTPSEAEKLNPTLYADNVRKVMAEALDIPCSDYQYEDGTLLCEIREKTLQKLKSIHRAKRALGLSGSINECSAILEATFEGEPCSMNFRDFQREFFHVADEDTVIPEVQTAFNCFKNDESNEGIDVRPYLVLTSIMYEEKMMIRLAELPRKICKMYGISELEASPKQILSLMEKLFELPDNEKKTEQTSGCGELEKRASRMLEFVKLFSDEVTERLPRNYPSREYRDKLQKSKLKQN